jgi:hypothetical protein
MKQKAIDIPPDLIFLDSTKRSTRDFFYIELMSYIPVEADIFSESILD